MSARYRDEIVSCARARIAALNDNVDVHEVFADDEKSNWKVAASCFSIRCTLGKNPQKVSCPTDIALPIVDIDISVAYRYIIVIPDTDISIL